jgi:hypothetical protein
MAQKVQSSFGRWADGCRSDGWNWCVSVAEEEKLEQHMEHCLFLLPAGGTSATRAKWGGGAAVAHADRWSCCTRQHAHGERRLATEGWGVGENAGGDASDAERIEGRRRHSLGLHVAL